MPQDNALDAAIRSAATAIASADALLIGAGAGMGVDSGLPDFRGDEGFWKAYPPFRGRKFHEMSNPRWFQSDPAQAWGFFGHRLHLYRRTIPHAGFAILKRWGEKRPGGVFVFTSNVDGQFQIAGFDPERILECHGSIHHMQCSRPCGSAIWSAEGTNVEVDEETFRALGDLPKCPHCGKVARPNILMFGDNKWLSDRCLDQEERYIKWRQSVAPMNVVAIELGAGLAIPTVRQICEEASRTLIRINPREADVPAGGISLPLPGFEALRRIDEKVG